MFQTFITFIKVEKNFRADKNWNWDDENSEELKEDELFTKCAFKMLLRDFRYRTPDNIIAIFKECVLFGKYARITSDHVRIKLNIFRNDRR